MNIKCKLTTNQNQFIRQRISKFVSTNYFYADKKILFGRKYDDTLSIYSRFAGMTI